jgi:D-3-phosphoglycerate dehydrogenase
MEKGIPVFNAPYSNTRSVAELVLAEMIMLLRDIPRKNMAMHKGVWCKSAKDSNEVRGKKLGIIGYGNIGSQLSILAEALGMRVIFYDIVTKLPLGTAIQVNALESLLKESDVVTLHVPETPATKNMISAKELQIMKKGSVLINASRGSVIDLNALKEALQNNHLKGAALDVYPEEPTRNNDSFRSFLQDMDNVIMTPHIGGSTQEAQISIAWKFLKKAY